MKYFYHSLTRILSIITVITLFCYVTSANVYIGLHNLDPASFFQADPMKKYCEISSVHDNQKT